VDYDENNVLKSTSLIYTDTMNIPSVHHSL